MEGPVEFCDRRKDGVGETGVGRDGSTRVSERAFEDWEDPGWGDWNWPRAADGIQCPVPWALKTKDTHTGGQARRAGHSGLPFLSLFLFSPAVSRHGTTSRKRWGAGVRARLPWP